MRCHIHCKCIPDNGHHQDWMSPHLCMSLLQKCSLNIQLLCCLPFHESSISCTFTNWTTFTRSYFRITALRSPTTISLTACSTILSKNICTNKTLIPKTISKKPCKCTEHKDLILMSSLNHLHTHRLHSCTLHKHTHQTDATTGKKLQYQHLVDTQDSNA